MEPMRYRIKAPVDGSVLLQPPHKSVSARRAGVEFSLEVGKTGTVSFATASAPVPSDKIAHFAGSIEPGDGRVAAKFRIGGDRELHEQLLAALQDLEIDLAFASRGGLERIRWSELEQSFIAETDDERAMLAVTSLTVSNAYPQPTVGFTPASFAKIVDYTTNTKELLAAKAFFIDGQRDFGQFRYAQAFINCYYVLEWLYADGQFRQKSVLRSFERSAVLNQGLEITLKTLSRDKTKWQAFVPQISSTSKPPTIGDLRRYLVETRGRVHHVSKKEPKRFHSATNRQRFEFPAFVVLMVAAVVLETEENNLKPRPYQMRKTL